MPQLRIEMLGGFRVQSGDRTISRFATQKAAGLLAYLAYFPDIHSREVLIDIFWPDSDLDAGRASLSQALSMLRRQIEPPGGPSGVLVANKTHVGLNKDAVETDVSEFDKAVRSSARAGRSDRVQLLEQAAGIYRGELLPGFYEDWIPGEQQRLAAQFSDVLERLIALLEESGEYLQAVDYARRAIDLDPLQEASYRNAMRLYAAASRFEEARQEFEQMKRELAEDLGEEPSADSRQLMAEIEGLAASASVKKTSVPQAKGQGERSLPRGTVTFLMTDIEGSTALWERAGESARDVLKAHHRILRHTFGEFSGIEVKEAGDGFLVAFESPSDALACAVACQKALMAADWPEELECPKVRLALHTGEVKIEEGEYRGPALHRASRILTAANGGQILASEAASAMLRRELPTGVRLVDLGVYRLRDISVPERLFQVNYDGMAQTDFPRLRADAGYQSNLPPQFTRFFGREEQLAQLSEMLQSGHTRLVTITGAGGTGKTRLALEVANRMLEPFSGAVWFVPLVDLSDPNLIAGAIVDALRIPRSAAADPLDQAVQALNRQPTLLILDNLEQFVEEGGQLVRALLERVPLLTCLATSRQSLSLSAEREYRLPPLAIPNGAAPPERLSMFESVRLFVDRAQAVKPDFQVTNQNAPAVAELCDRLEGIPLAIELAAARASILSASQMLLQLERRFEFLVGKKRDSEGRHRTLRAAMDWSYDLLPPEVQRFFTRLSVFRGGWTIEAAADVCEEPTALEYLDHLQSGSLIQTYESLLGMRYRMLETMREHGQEKLVGDERDRVEKRHEQFVLEFSNRDFRCDSKEKLDTFEVEHDNIRAAMATSLAAERLTTFGEIACNLRFFSELRGHVREEATALGTVISLISPDDNHDLVRRAHWGSAWATGNSGNHDASVSHARISLAMARESGEVGTILAALYTLGGFLQSVESMEESKSLLQEMHQLAKEHDNQHFIAMGHNMLGEGTRLEGDLESALLHYETSLAMNRSLGSPAQYVSGVLINIARVQLRRAEYVVAAECLGESLSISTKVGLTQHPVEAAACCALLALHIDQPERGAELIGAAHNFYDTHSMAIQYADMIDYEFFSGKLREKLGSSFNQHVQAGRELSLEQSTRIALDILDEFDRRNST